MTPIRRVIQDLLVGLVVELTLHPRDGVFATLEAAPVDAEPARVDVLQNLVRQWPLSDDRREHWSQGLSLLTAEDLRGSGGVVAAAARLLREGAPRIPTLSIPAVRLRPAGPALDGALALLVDLDRTVPEPWTLIGGLMVQITCLQHGVTAIRATVDADIVVGVFTHRHALTVFTSQLRDRDFADVTPSPLGGEDPLAYRWRRGDVLVDVTVPPKVNDQTRPPRASGGRSAVELPATQQALRRTQRMPVRLATGDEGHLRRPDLLGAVVIKSEAAVMDRREPERHREDLVVLADIMAHEGSHVTYLPVMRAKDAERIRRASALVTDREWRRARDPEAARGALAYLVIGREE